MTGNIKLLALLFLFGTASLWAAPGTAAQIKSQKQALKNIEKELTQTRKQLSLLENQEKGVIHTLSVLDQNLSQTREYVSAMIENETTLHSALTVLGHELDSLNKSIEEQQTAMKNRIRELYIRGQREQWETLYQLFLQNKNPERHAYMVKRLVSEDRERVEHLGNLMRLRQEKQKQQNSHLNEIQRLRKKKSEEERGLLQQIGNQNTVLNSLKTNRKMQQQALREFERNQKTMIALIAKLEKKRKEEEAARRRAEEERKRKQASSGSRKTEPKEVAAPAVVGPKCMPLAGAVISRYGLQEHAVLHIRTKNIGVEIRGKRGQAVKAAAKGTVVMVEEIDGRGPSVFIQHAGGVYSAYGHLSSIRVKEGDEVRNCEEIGVVGDVASLNGVKLYFQVSEGTRPIDPLQWLNRK
ncbi:MAG: peptidoglycan DD-metalloendopeptidase family protein [Fibrobacter sp.]|jgi:septal ring factor EnvC (AmiA/AmiB activator)|nr:peptidoglycan DD-metalloendopeptidase family protein [Fibrobacter sp.]